MQNYEQDKAWFDDHEAHVLGVSVDAVPSKVEWAKSLGGVSFDLLSDFHPHGAVAEAFGVARDGGISERALFVVDKDGKIAFAKVYDIPTLPDNAEVRQADREALTDCSGITSGAAARPARRAGPHGVCCSAAEWGDRPHERLATATSNAAVSTEPATLTWTKTR